MTAQETRALVNAALADPTVDLAIPLGISLAFRGPRRLSMISMPFGASRFPPRSISHVKNC
ncbi:hypothetical protein [Streptomyces sp. NEAU-174]|uniref:hypothetical protein n=1 Tax=Streptomyces sp. NEAU-174 TaxID=3458254 RepID=UPI0040440FB3